MWVLLLLLVKLSVVWWSTAATALEDCSFVTSGASSLAATNLNFSGSALACRVHFSPKEKQVVLVTLQSLDELPIAPNETCTTFCNDELCTCETDNLNDATRIIISTGDKAISCLCGDINHVLPMTIKTTETITFQHIAGEFDNNSDHFVSLSYLFEDYHECGAENVKDLSGIIFSNEESPSAQQRSKDRVFHYISCTWVIHNREGYIIILDLSASGNGNCSYLSITVSPTMTSNGTLSPTDTESATFCSGDKRRVVEVSNAYPLATVRMLTVGKRILHYKIGWIMQGLGEPLDNNKALRIASRGCTNTLTPLLLIIYVLIHLVLR